MNPQLLLSLWRERWGKAQSAEFSLPYAQGKLTQWTQRVSNAALWRVPAATGSIVVFSLMALALLVCADLSLNSQIIYSAVVVTGALYARRFEGRLISLVLLMLAVTLSTRYFGWRVGSTLDSNMNWHFVVGFILCLAELMVWLPLILRTSLAVSPIQQHAPSLPTKRAEWPSLDIALLVKDASGEDVARTASLLTALAWPQSSITFIDITHRDEMHRLAQASQAKYIVLPEHEAAAPLLLALLKNQGDAELIAVLEASHFLSNTPLRDAVAYFSDDDTLGLLLSPDNLLTITPTKAAQPWLAEGTNPGLVMVRRAMLDLLDEQATAPQHAVATWLGKSAPQGYSSAHIAVSCPRTDLDAPSNVPELSTEQAASTFCVAHPIRRSRLLLERYANGLMGMLAFYTPLTRLVFFLAPLAFCYWNIRSIQTNADLFLAFFVPHWLLGYSLHTRLDTKERLPLVLEVREFILASYLLVRTVLLATLTSTRRFLKRVTFRLHTTAPYSKEYATQLATQWLLIALYGGAIGSVMVRTGWSGINPQSATTIFLGWVTYCLLINIGALAVENEAEEILAQTRTESQQSAMLRLPNGRSVACTTENFPALQLRLALPTRHEVALDASAGVSIFRGLHEVSFQARIAATDGNAISVQILEDAQPDYQAFAQALRTRGPDWPRWLPGRNADQLLPKWLSKVKATMIDVVWHAGSKVGSFFTGLRKSK